MFAVFFCFCLLKNFYLFIFRERKGGRREGEEYQCVVVSLTHPDWELNHQPFGSHPCAQSAEPHQPGLNPNSLANYNDIDKKLLSNILTEFTRERLKL